MTGDARERSLAELVDALEQAASLYWAGRDSDAGNLLARANDVAEVLGLPPRASDP
jgi:hypothetical protein